MIAKSPPMFFQGLAARTVLARAKIEAAAAKRIVVYKCLDVVGWWRLFVKKESVEEREEAEVED